MVWKELVVWKGRQVCHTLYILVLQSRILKENFSAFFNTGGGALIMLWVCFRQVNQEGWADSPSGSTYYNWSTDLAGHSGFQLHQEVKLKVKEHDVFPSEVFEYTDNIFDERRKKNNHWEALISCIQTSRMDFTENRRGKLWSRHLSIVSWINSV